MTKFRKKPAIEEVEAIQWWGDNPDTVRSYPEVVEFVGEDWRDRIQGRGQNIYLDLPKNLMIISAGDWIIKDSKGKITGCKNEYFEKTYEEVTV